MAHIPEAQLDVRSRLIARASKDPAFRKQLLSNPKAAIEAETGEKLPDGYKYSVVESDEDTLVLVIPRLPTVSAGQVADRELKAGSAGAPGVGNTWFKCNTATGSVTCWCGPGDPKPKL